MSAEKTKPRKPDATSDAISNHVVEAINNAGQLNKKQEEVRSASRNLELHLGLISTAIVEATNRILKDFIYFQTGQIDSGTAIDGTFTLKTPDLGIGAMTRAGDILTLATSGPTDPADSIELRATRDEPIQVGIDPDTNRHSMRLYLGGENQIGLHLTWIDTEECNAIVGIKYDFKNPLLQAFIHRYKYIDPDHDKLRDLEEAAGFIRILEKAQVISYKPVETANAPV